MPGIGEGFRSSSLEPAGKQLDERRARIRVRAVRRMRIRALRIGRRTGRRARIRAQGRCRPRLCEQTFSTSSTPGNQSRLDFAALKVVQEILRRRAHPRPRLAARMMLACSSFRRSRATCV